MTRSGAAFVLLAVLTGAGLAAAIAARPAPLPPAALPADLVRGMPPDLLEKLNWSRGGAFWERHGIEIARAPNPGGPPILVFRPTRPLAVAKPDVYWAIGGLRGGGPVPKDAVRLGPLNVGRAGEFVAPPAMGFQDGRFLLVDGARGNVVAETATAPPRSGS